MRINDLPENPDQPLVGFRYWPTSAVEHKLLSHILLSYERAHPAAGVEPVGHYSKLAEIHSQAICLGTQQFQPFWLYPAPAVHPPGEPIPSPNCSCGLYANYRPEDVRIAGLERLSPVWGIVQAWGRIVLHGEGFRSEFMRPVALYAPFGSRIYASFGSRRKERTEMVAKANNLPIVDPAIANEFGYVIDPQNVSKTQSP